MKSLGGLHLGSGARTLVVNRDVAAHKVAVKGQTPHRSLSLASRCSTSRYGDAFLVCELQRREHAPRRPGGFEIRSQSLASPPTQTKQVCPLLQNLPDVQFSLELLFH
jgi:hypothetical protein